jgi:hypothetical protein
MRYSLITVYKRNEDGTVNGNVLQNKMGELPVVLNFASETSKLNSNQDIAVVDEVAGRIGDYYHNLTPLDFEMGK